MLIQLSNNIVVNPDNVILVPAKERPRGSVDSYRVMTSDMREITIIPQAECETLLHLAATQRDVPGATAPGQSGVLRTCEWAVLEGRLNYRYARTLMKTLHLHGESELTERLKGEVLGVLKNGAGVEAQIKVIEHLGRLTADQEFYSFAVDGRKKLYSLCYESHAPAAQRLAVLRDKWDEYFTDLPF